MGLFRLRLDSTTSKRLALGQKHNHQTVVVLASHSRNAFVLLAPIPEDLTVLRLAHHRALLSTGDDYVVTGSSQRQYVSGLLPQTRSGNIGPFVHRLLRPYGQSMWPGLTSLAWFVGGGQSNQ